MTTPNTRPWLKFLLSALAAGVVVAVLALPLRFGESRLPPLGTFLNPYEGALRSTDPDYYLDVPEMPGLRAPVEVYYDERLVPHIYAATAEDLYYAQGYVQAQHRLFQLDLTARAAEGRLSEVLGPRTREIDLRRRRIGGGPLATQMDSLWREDPTTYTAAQRYAEGVNAYIATLSPADYPIEYKLLDFAPSEWSPRHTALVAVNMAYVLNSGSDDVPATRIRERFGAEAYEYLYPLRTPEDAPVIPAGTPFGKTDTALLNASRGLGRQPEPVLGEARGGRPRSATEGFEGTREGIGSNNWAVGPSRTASGFPLLANDPHLQLTLPSIWFESELHAEGIAVHGVSLPGVPGITIGFNADCAWGVTNVGQDVVDWREVVYTDAARTRSQTGPGTTAPVRRRIERIGVRGEADLVDTVMVTSHGPVVYAPDEEDARAGLAMDWLTLRRPSVSSLAAFLRLNTASTLDDYLAASRSYEWPAQNMVFANRAGDIALRVSGTLPRQLPGQGEFVRRPGDPGVDGYIDPAENPVAINPEQGYLASANQISTAADYPYEYRGYFDHHRGRRINQLLRNTTGATPETMAAYQLDDYGLQAAEMTPVMLATVSRGNLSARALGLLQVLETWDYRYTADAFAPVIFETWVDEVARQTWDEFEEMDIGGRAIAPADWRLGLLIEQDAASEWFDNRSTEQRETARVILAQALTAVETRLDSLDQLGDYDWATENAPAVNHLTRIPAFSRRGLRTGGRGGTLNAIQGDVGPSWRMIVDLSPPVRASVVYPGGQSGRPGHPHYDDFVDAWAAGEYYDVGLRTRAEAEASSLTKITLAP